MEITEITETIPVTGLADPLAQAACDTELAAQVATGLLALAEAVRQHPRYARAWFDALRQLSIGVGGADDMARLLGALKYSGAHLCDPPWQWSFASVMACFGPVSVRVYLPQIADSKPIPASAILAQLEGERDG